MRTRTSFFHARFSTELEPPTGSTRLSDRDRLRGNLALLETATTLIATHVVTDLVLMLLRVRARSPRDQLVQSATTYLDEHCASAGLSFSAVCSMVMLEPSSR